MTRDLEPQVGARLTVPDFDFTFRFVEADNVTAAERQRMLDLLRDAFNGGPSWFFLGVDPAEHLRWKLDGFPGTAQVEMIEDGDRLVGMAIAFRRQFLIDGELVIGRDGVDLGIAPAAQGRGVQTVRRLTMREVWKQLHPTVRFQISVTTHPASWHLRARAGTQPFANYLEAHTKVLSFRHLRRRSETSDAQSGASRTRTVVEGRARSLPALLDRASLALRLVAARIPRWRGRARAFTGSIVTLEQFDDRVDGFWADAASAFSFIQVRDRAFLNWRFCDRRAGPFLVRAAFADEELLGYAALRSTDRELVIADLLARPDRPDVVEALLRDAVRIAREQGVAMVQSWLPHVHPHRESFRRLGFVTRSIPLGLGYESWTDEVDLSFLADPDAPIHAMHADTDHI